MEAVWATVVQFAVFRNIGQIRSKVRPPSFREAEFQLFKEIVSGIPGILPSGAMGWVEQGWYIFKDVFYRVQ